ncbi:MAG: hypothetical protein OYH76_18350 [Defluviicoccus sp.]|nr:hypothetical protein [Defluviicoccus sp.]MDE0277860.1 hypothetical protein [Defluviicoccus sp.]
MARSDFSIDDVLFRRTGDDLCAILVFGRQVGTLIRLRDHDDPADPWYYVISLLRDPEGPRQVEHRSQVRLAAADMLWQRGLVPFPDHPGHPLPASRPDGATAA